MSRCACAIVATIVWTAAADAAIDCRIRTLPPSYYASKPLPPVNRRLLDHDFSPKAQDEPQVIFRNDARDRFDETLRYGHRPKAEFLVHIGVPGPWHKWPRTVWETPRKRALDLGSFAVGGWVARLNPQADTKVEAGDSTRWIARIFGIAAHCSNLDRALFDRDKVVANTNCYAHLLRQSVGTTMRSGPLLETAVRYLDEKPVSVTEKASLPRGASANDYVSYARYWHEQDDNTAIRIDGVVNPAAAGDSALALNDRARFQKLVDVVTTLALATEVSGERRYAERAASFVLTWFIEPETRMSPSLRFAQIRTASATEISVTGPVDFRDLWPLCDALRLMRRAGVLDADTQHDLDAWFRALLDYLLKRAMPTGNRTNNIGVLFDLVLASVSAYAGDITTLATALNRQSLRVHTQIGDYGAQHAEMRRAAPLHYSLFGLQALINMAWFARNVGLDIWQYAGERHRSIPMAARFITLNRPLFDDYQGPDERFADRIEVALRAIPQDAADYEVIGDLPRRPITNMEGLGADDGIPPWWVSFLCNAGTQET